MKSLLIFSIVLAIQYGEGFQVPLTSNYATDYDIPEVISADECQVCSDLCAPLCYDGEDLAFEHCCRTVSDGDLYASLGPTKRMFEEAPTVDEFDFDKRADQGDLLRLGKRANTHFTRQNLPWRKRLTDSLRLGKRSEVVDSIRLGRRSLGDSMRLGKKSIGDSMRLGKRSLGDSMRLGKKSLGDSMRLGKRSLGDSMRLGKRSLGDSMRLGKRQSVIDSMRLGKRQLSDQIRLGKRQLSSIADSMRLGKRQLEDQIRLGKKSADVQLPPSAKKLSNTDFMRLGKRSTDDDAVHDYALDEDEE